MAQLSWGVNAGKTLTHACSCPIREMYARHDQGIEAECQQIVEGNNQGIEARHQHIVSGNEQGIEAIYDEMIAR
jgi:Fe2+ transport system protein B